MPSLGIEHISARSSSGLGEPFAYKSQVTVDRKGIFSLTLPEELVSTAEKLVRAQGGSQKFSIARLRVNWVISGRDKAECSNFIKNIIRDYLACEVIRETVIVYTTSAALAYWKTGAGEIVPNGGYDPDYDSHKGVWGGENNATQCTETFSVGLAAKVYVKVTARRESGDQISYERTYGEGDHFSRDTWLQKLNSFVGLAFGDYSLEETKQIPYDEDSAKFFYDNMIAMCRLSDRIEGFFSNPANIQKAIETRTSFMLPASASEQSA